MAESKIKNQKSKLAGFFDPYLDTLGGGERYTLTLAEHLLEKGWEVDIFWDKPQIKDYLTKKFNLKIQGVKFIPSQQNLLKKFKITRNYNFFFWVSDGSIPFLFSKNNILHFQVPFHDVNGQSRLNKIKLKKINHLVCNSKFTKKFIDKEYGVSSKVIYPPIDVENFKPGRKKNIVLSVGRFSQLLQAKRQDVLVSAFKKLYSQGLKDWQFILAGATGVGGRQYFKKLKSKAKGYPIDLLADVDFKSIKKLYSEAKIFWSASGFGIDEERQPEKVEHFGIAVVEAMAAGCLPVVIGKGGVREIIKEGKTGFLWQKEEELIEFTRKLIIQPQILSSFSRAVIKSSQKFSKKRFNRKFDGIIE